MIAPSFAMANHAVFDDLFAAEPANSLVIVRNRTTPSFFRLAPPTFDDGHRYNDEIFAILASTT